MSISPIYPDLPGFDKENRELVYAMVDAGWTGRITSKRHWLGKAPDGKTTITIPSKNGNNRGLKNAHATFMRWLRDHLSPELVELWDKAKDEDDPIVKDTLAESVVKKHAVEIMHQRDERVHRKIIEAIENGDIIVEPLIRPWLARKHSGKDGGTRYESQTTLEVIWPDGKTEYRCALPGCDWTSDKPRSVAMHYGQEHTRKGESEPAGTGPHHLDPDYTEPVTSREYRPTDRMVTLLADVLASLKGKPFDEAAVELLTFLHDRPDIEHVTREMAPLTDADIVNRIRVLVGQPLAVENDSLREQVSMLEATVEQRTVERDEATRRLLKVQQDVDALREILGGIGA